MTILRGDLRRRAADKEKTDAENEGEAEGFHKSGASSGITSVLPCLRKQNRHFFVTVAARPALLRSGGFRDITT